YGRFSQFHDRHFRFAQVFLEAAFPGCTTALNAVPRLVPDVRVEGLFGGASVSGGGAATFGGAVSVGLPLLRLRQLELRLGAQGIYLRTIPPLYRDALLLGATIGLEGRTSPASLAPTFGVFGSAGAYRQFGVEGTSYRAPTPARTSGYAEAGGSIGITSGMFSGGVSLGARAEAAAGSEITRDPDAMRWFRIGVGLGGTF